MVTAFNYHIPLCKGKIEEKSIGEHLGCSVLVIRAYILYSSVYIINLLSVFVRIGPNTSQKSTPYNIMVCVSNLFTESQKLAFSFSIMYMLLLLVTSPIPYIPPPSVCSTLFKKILENKERDQIYSQN